MVISGQTVVGCDGNSTATNEYYNYYTTAASAGIPYWFYKLFAFYATASRSTTDMRCIHILTEASLGQSHKHCQQYHCLWCLYIYIVFVTVIVKGHEGKENKVKRFRHSLKRCSVSNTAWYSHWERYFIIVSWTVLVLWRSCVRLLLNSN